MADALPSQVLDGLRELGLVDDPRAVAAVPLAGGVASDIWRVDAGERTFCVKRALARLKVARTWEVPVERNRFEVAWFAAAAAIEPAAVPEILGHAPAHGFFAMAWLPPDRFPVWKTQLRDGRVDTATAARVGERLARIHAGTAGDASVRERFATDDLFHAIRVEPYLLATAERHPDLAGPLHRLAAALMAGKHALVHGDVSPKNLLIGPDGPLFLDAECAWYGDPAFDLAFCINHLLLKCRWRPRAADALLAAYARLVERYLAGVDWEPAVALEGRAARLLPGLLLARIDGKSPVEYLDDAAQRDAVRAFARQFLARPSDSLAALADAWRAALRAPPAGTAPVTPR